MISSLDDPCLDLGIAGLEGCLLAGCVVVQLFADGKSEILKVLADGGALSCGVFADTAGEDNSVKSVHDSRIGADELLDLIAEHFACELSLVVAGANPGAFIDFVDLAHGEGAEQEVIFCANEPITLAHADEGKADDSADDGKKSADGDKKDTGDGDTIEDVINSLTEKQKTVVVALLANAMAHSDSDDDDGEEKKDDGHIEHSDKSEGGDKTMKHNVFEKPEDNQATTLSHSAQTEIIASARASALFRGL